MTFISSFAILPKMRGELRAPFWLAYEELSLVIPVRNNPDGIRRLLESCLEVFTSRCHPREIIVVDNLSHPPLPLPYQAGWGLPLRILACTRLGPAAARNLGVRHATGEWVLFLDSNCLLTPTLISGYQQAMNGAIAYAGVVRALHQDVFSLYYESEGILSPFQDTVDECKQYCNGRIGEKKQRRREPEGANRCRCIPKHSELSRKKRPG